MKYLFQKDVTVADDHLSSKEKRYEVIRASGMSTNVWTLPVKEDTFIPVDERRFRTSVVTALGSLTVCYVGQPLDAGYVDMQEVPIGRYETYDEME